VFYASEAAVVGSIGVIATLYDQTRALKNQGVDPTVIRSSELKAPGAGDTITPSQMRNIVSRVQEYFGMFKDAVARARSGIDIDAVATGETWIGQKAVAAGLVDGIGTLDSVTKKYG
jgi:serine protease SohB